MERLNLISLCGRQAVTAFNGWLQLRWRAAGQAGGRGRVGTVKVSPRIRAGTGEAGRQL